MQFLHQPIAFAATPERLDVGRLRNALPTSGMSNATEPWHHRCLAKGMASPRAETTGFSIHRTSPGDVQVVSVAGHLGNDGAYGVDLVGLEGLDEKIPKLRRQVPSRVLSLYDQLARQYADPLTALADGVCQGCRQQVSRRLRHQTANPQCPFQCADCGRLLFVQNEAPDYVS